MIGKNRVLAVAALMVGLLLPGQLLAAWTAVTRADLNLRVGPDTIYGVIDVIPQGFTVDVLGCLDDIAWCDVEWDGLRGWVSARYLVQPGTSVYLPQWAPSVGIPIITFSFDRYHDRYYRGQPWYRERRWSGRRHRARIEQPRRRPQVEERRRRPQAEERRRGRPQVEERRRRPQVEERQRRGRPQAEERRRRPQAEERRRRGRPQAEQQTQEEPRRSRAQRRQQSSGEAEPRRRRWVAPDPSGNFGQ